MCVYVLCVGELTEMFPLEPPHLLLCSVYYKVGSHPLQCSLNDCPYNSKLEIDENAKRLKYVFHSVSFHCMSECILMFVFLLQGLHIQSPS